MKIFLKKCTIFFLIWAVVFVISYLVIPRKYYSRDDFDVVQTVVAKIKSNGLHCNILIGDSKPLMGIDARTLHACNFAFGAETPIEGFYEVREILNNKTNHIDTVFLSYSHKHFIIQECFYTNSYYYGAFDTKYLDSARQIAMSYNDVNYKYKPQFGILQCIPGLNTPAANQKEDRLFQFVSAGFNNIAEYFKKKHSGKIPNGNNQLVNGRLSVMPSDNWIFDRARGEQIADEDLSYVIPSKVNTIYFQKILDLCKQKHVHVTFIQTPSIKMNRTASLQRHINSLRNLFGRDFIQDTSYYADHYFRDYMGHLNVEGINRFNAFLQKKLYGSADVDAKMNKIAPN